jgi:MFS family permease
MICWVSLHGTVAASPVRVRVRVRWVSVAGPRPRQGPVGGALADKYGRPAVLLPGMGGAAAATAALVAAPSWPAFVRASSPAVELHDMPVNPEQLSVSGLLLSCRQ